MNRLYFLELSETTRCDMFRRLSSFVSPQRREQIRHFHFDIDKELSVYSEILVRLIIMDTLRIRYDEIVFEKNEYGKPFLKDYPDFYFNLSHTNNAIAVIISDHRVGVDIEKIKSANLKIAERFFTPSEVDFITQKDTNRDKRFFEIWTKKEAYIKYVGKGLSIPFKSFDVLDSAISSKMHTIKKENYLVSVCSEYPYPDLKIMELSVTDIRHRFCFSIETTLTHTK